MRNKNNLITEVLFCVLCYREFDDDGFVVLNERHALSSLKNNTSGGVYGLIYDRQYIFNPICLPTFSKQSRVE